MVQLDATRPIPVIGVRLDGDGNVTEKVTLKPGCLKARGFNGSAFGTINDAGDTFNPGNSGALGEIVYDDPDSGDYAAVSVEVNSGTLPVLKLAIVDKKDHVDVHDDRETLPTPGTGRDTRPYDPPALGEFQAGNRDRANAQGKFDQPSDYAEKNVVDTVEAANYPAVAKAANLGGTGEAVLAKGDNPSAALTNSHASVTGDANTRLAPVEGGTAVATDVPGQKDDSGDAYTFENSHAPQNGESVSAVVRQPVGGPTVGAATSLEKDEQDLGGKTPVSHEEKDAIESAKGQETVDEDEEDDEEAHAAALAKSEKANDPKAKSDKPKDDKPKAK